MSAPSVSFEIFPPASIRASFKLWDSLARLQGFDPDYVSVTYGAQGGAQDRTLDSALAVQSQTGAPVAAHLTAARASKAQVLARAESFAKAGIRDVVALRGDAEEAGAAFEPHPDGFANSLELIAALAAQDRFTIRVGAYPESHPDAASQAQNIDYLKAKFEAGADAALSQFFFEPETFLRFRDACAAAGITKPIYPGILPITNWRKIRGFAQSCGAEVPAWMDQAFEKAERDERSDLLSLTIASEMCERLLREGVEHLHIYTLNSAKLSERLLLALGVPYVQPALRHVA